ncbi:MAG: hypothetical protein JWO54_147 [Candidatus Saccharibacteria bacterium]|nr:hypothetical protein [Candidatus Saccharibacteria bacterium]MDB5180389.1 hypothetical protein [Candidatus Saccharibacteria bacterium]
MGFGSGGSGGSSVAGSNDVALSNPANTEVLSYDSATSKWKNAATITPASLDLKAPLESPAFTGTPTGITKAHVGLGSVDNTSDAAKPVSTATQTALNTKQDTSAKGQANGYASLDGSTLVPRTQLGTGTPDGTKVLYGDGTWAVPAATAAPVQSVAGKTGTVTLVKGDVGLANVDNTADSAKPVSTATQSALDLKAPLASPAFTGTPTGITKNHVGLNNVDNTSDISKPISSATINALDLKAPILNPSFTGQVGGVTKAHVGLGNVDNTSDANKPISAATQTALTGKASTIHSHSATDVTSGVFSTARLPAATDTTVGVVELATTAEVVTGTDTILAVTPAGVKAAVTASLHPVVFINTLGDLPAGTPVDTLVVVRAA